MSRLPILPLLMLILITANLSAQKDSTLTVMTYNIWNGYDYGKDKERERQAITFIQSQNPDVVALQELVGFTAESLKEFARSYGHEYSVILKEKGYPVGLTSNKPIHLKTKMLAGLWHGMLHARTHNIDFLVVHLSPADVEFRQREARIITQYMKGALGDEENYIVLGDFNAHSPFDASLDEQRPELLKRKQASDSTNTKRQNLLDNHHDYSVMSQFMGYPLIDVSKRYVSDENRFSFPAPILVGIWREPGEIVPTRVRIDYIMTSRRLARHTTSARIINSGIVDKLSDHYPVVSEFAFE